GRVDDLQPHPTRKAHVDALRALAVVWYLLDASDRAGAPFGTGRMDHSVPELERSLLCNHRWLNFSIADGFPPGNATPDLQGGSARMAAPRDDPRRAVPVQPSLSAS